MFKIIDSLEVVDFDRNRYLYVDTETAGLFGDVRLVQMYQTHFDKPIIVDTKSISIKEIVSYLKQFSCVFHNAHYDLTCFDRETGILLDNFEDTFLAGRILMPYLRSFSLDTMLEEVLGTNPYNDFLAPLVDEKYSLDKLKSKMQKSDWSKELDNSQLTYASIDVLYLPKLWQLCVEGGLLDNTTYLLDKKSMSLMIKFQKTGLPFNRKKLDELRLVYETEYNQAIHSLSEDININSPKQVKEYLNIDASDDSTLAKLQANGSKDAEMIRKARKASKLLQFINIYGQYDNRVTGKFNVVTKSGRSSCKGENLQQIPQNLKGIFETDKYFVYADFSNLELRTFCALVGEQTMATKFRNNEDLHTFTAKSLFGVSEVTKQQRQIAKTFNFSSLYGAGVQKRLEILLKTTGIALSLEEGQDLARKWLNTYPQVKEWQDYNFKSAREGAIGYTALGRPYKAELYTDFGNILVQGTGAEVSKVTLDRLDKELDIKKLCVFIHDSYTFECDTLDEAKHYARILANAMKLSWNDFKPYFKVDVDMPVEAVIGKNWKDCQNNENIIWNYEI